VREREPVDAKKRSLGQLYDWLRFDTSKRRIPGMPAGLGASDETQYSGQDPLRRIRAAA